MALKASGLAGTAKLHDLTSSSNLLCDLCGEEVDSEVADAVALDCSFAQCDPASSCYHAHCLEKFLKSIRCERNRKIGFPCPRGCGKGTKFKDACRGKILKSHPVTIRSEANKKRRQAELEQLAQQAAKDKAAKKKEEEAKAAAAAAASKAAAAGKDKGKDKGKQAAKVAPTIKALNVANTAITNAAPPRTQAQLQKEQLAAAAKNLKSQILRQGSGGSTSSSVAGATKLSSAASGRLSAAGSVPARKEVKTLDEYLAERTGASSAALDRSSSMASSSAPQASVWGKSRASSISSLEAAELQQEAAVAALAAAPAPPVPAALSSDDAFPPPASAAASAAAGKPPRPPSSAAAAAPAAPAVPTPAPAAVQPQGVWAQKPAVAVVAAAPPPPPPPRAAGTSPAAPALAAAPASQAAKAKAGAAAAQPTVAPATATPAAADDSKLSRTQRKNQKRAEKKAAAAAAAEAAAGSPEAGTLSPPDSLPASPQAAAPAGSLQSPLPPASTAGAAGVPPVAEMGVELVGGGGAPGFTDTAGYEGGGAASLMELGYSESFERCMQALVQHKLQHQVEQLQQLGFPAAAALAAVQQHGGNLEGALVTLIEQSTGVQDSMHGLGLSASSAPAEVDLTDELQFMQELQVRYGLPPGTIEMLAVEHQGDLDSLAASLAAQQQAMLAFSNSNGGSGMAAQQQQAMVHQGRQESLALPAEPLSPGAGAGVQPAGGLAAGGLAGEQSYSEDSWGQHSAGGATTSLDTASSKGGCYSAFGFSGFAEAALHAVHGGGLSSQASLFGSMDGTGTPTSRDHPTPALGAGIWGSSASSPHASGLAPAGFGGASDFHAHAHAHAHTHAPPSLLGPSGAAAAAAAAAASSGFGLLGSFDALQPSSTQSIFDSRVGAGLPASAGFLPFPGGGGGGSGLQHPHPPASSSSSGWQSNEGMLLTGGSAVSMNGLAPGLQRPQQPFSSLPLWGNAGGAGLGGLGAGLPAALGSSGGLQQERELNELMSTLLVR